MNAALTLGIDAQTWQVGGSLILAFCAVASWMLGGTIVADAARPAHGGRHRGGRRRPRPAQVAPRRANAARRSHHAEPDVFDRVLAAWATPHAARTDSVLPFVPGPGYRDEPDDWTADLPTAQLATIVEAPRHASPSDRARERWQTECPIFAALADELGYDAARGFDTGLVAA